MRDPMDLELIWANLPVEMKAMQGFSRRILLHRAGVETPVPLSELTTAEYTSLLYMARSARARTKRAIGRRYRR